MDKAPPAMPDVEQAIVDYLRRHPQAVDTERGIREWWLHDLRQQCSASDVQHAIDRRNSRTSPGKQHFCRAINDLHEASRAGRVRVDPGVSNARCCARRVAGWAGGDPGWVPGGPVPAAPVQRQGRGRTAHP